MVGHIIVVEGLDGSGKATQSNLLCDAYKSRGAQVRRISFPDYDSRSSALAQMYLQGEFGTEPSDVNAYAASSFFAVDRFASYKKDWGREYRDGAIVIADRYATSNAVHQCSKLPRAEWDAYLDWLFDFEYRLMGIPAPTAVVYLHVDPEVSQRLMSERYHGDERKKDIHEKNLAYLRASQEAALYCREKLGWLNIDCCRDGQMRPIGEIHRDVLAAVDAKLGI